jgi:hypothetical protein
MNIKPLNLIFSATFLAAIAIANPISMNSSMAQEEQNEKINISEEKGEDSPEAKNLVDLNLAYNLAEYGREKKDPQMLISAAKIIMETPVESLSLEKTTEEDPEAEAAKEETKTDEERDLSANALLTEARELAKGDASMIATIDELEGSTTASRGKIGAPIRSVTSVQARSIDSYTIPFEGGRIARIVVDGDNDTDLDCYLYDEYGNAVVRDADYSDTCVLQWTPRWSGDFTLRIRNGGSVYNRYYLLTN